MQWSMSASYVEVYNESFRDLSNVNTKPADITIYEQQ